MAQAQHLISPEESEPDRVVEQYHISREAQDSFALMSHQKAVRAADDWRFENEIISVRVATRKGEIMMESDEGPRRDTTLEALAKLKPAFRSGGTVTAGNSSSLNDRAAAILLASREYVEAHGLKPLARIRSMT